MNVLVNRQLWRNTYTYLRWVQNVVLKTRFQGIEIIAWSSKINPDKYCTIFWEYVQNKDNVWQEVFAILEILELTFKVISTFNAGLICRVIYHNLSTWRDSSQVEFTSEESCQWTNYKTKYKFENQNPTATWEQSCQFYLGTIVSACIRNNSASVTREKLCQSHLGTILPWQIILYFK